ncbi:MAG: permease [Sphaerochaeta sp.]
MRIFKQYRLALIAVALIALTLLFSRDTGLSAVKTVGLSAKEMLLILPPVFIMLGLLDVWVPREAMVRFMGEGSGLLGGLLSWIIGVAAAGPLYVVFPIAAAFMKKGVKFTNILILIGAWSTMKVPMVMFEFSSLGARFALTRLIVNIPVILIMAFILNRVLSSEDKEAINQRAELNG